MSRSMSPIRSTSRTFSRRAPRPLSPMPPIPIQSKSASSSPPRQRINHGHPLLQGTAEHRDPRCRFWSSSGALLATATFTGETGSGWQDVSFASPVAITAGATYTASYHTNVGEYSESSNYFTAPVTSGDLTAPANAGVYAYGTGSIFPTNSSNATNYWVDVDYTSVACFCAGTMIATPQGEVAVEALVRGDLVIATDGRVVPVSWLGVQTVSRRFADPLRTQPIRVKAGALGDETPCRDLLLSPDHALFIDGLLIHAGALVNGTSIIRETEMPEVFVYYHVETDDHSLILAENAPAETFVDNVDRMNFDNWAEHEALFSGGKAIDELPYPRAKARRQVPMSIRAALDARAQVIDAAKFAAA